MESLPPFVSYLSQQSKKKEFPGSNSSWIDAAEETPQPLKRIPKSLKLKEIPFPQIIDVTDVDDEDDKEDEEVMILSAEEAEKFKKSVGFKSFDTIEDYSDHHFSSYGSSSNQPTKKWAKKIQDEWRILENDLPDTIFVRVYESRMDLLRAVIIGAEGTPYHDGLFFFDVFFPQNYPTVPPKVHYHSHGLRINPNLYNCGKVCLSLLNTWSGGKEEKWNPKLSTTLQVLVSIQGLILNAKPYFNEPGYAPTSGTPMGQKHSDQYNENTLILSLKTMVYTINKPPKYFGDFVAGHFRKRGGDILLKCKSYIDGAEVGSLVKGGVQDVDESDKCCSQKFKDDLAAYSKTLVDAFVKVGVKDCEKFLPSEKIKKSPPPPDSGTKRKRTKQH